jgi:hypothetical protein
MTNRVLRMRTTYRANREPGDYDQEYQFKSSPYPGQNSVQRVVIFGDMGKVIFFLFSPGGSNSNHVRNTENTFCRNIYTYMHKLHLTSQGYLLPLYLFYSLGSLY